MFKKLTYITVVAALLIGSQSCESTKLEKAELTENSISENCGEGDIGGVHINYHSVSDVPEMDSDFLNDKLYEAYNQDFQQVTGYELQDADHLVDQAINNDCMEGFHFDTEVVQNGDGFLEIAFATTYYENANEHDDKETHTGEIRIDLNEIFEEWILLIQQRH